MLKALWLNPSIVLIVIKLFVDRNNYAFITVVILFTMVVI